MKITLLQNIIKEAVREVIREELLNSIPKEKNINRNFSTNEPPIQYESSTASSTLPSSKLQEVLASTKAEMTSNDYKNIIGDTGNNPPLGMSTSILNEENAGLDISALSFVKKANLTFKKSLEIDKNRTGI